VSCEWARAVALLFVDDVVIFSNSREELQRLLDACYNFSCKWWFEWNVGKKKSDVMVWGGRCELLQECMLLGRFFLGVTTEYKYLGLMVDKGGLGRRAREELVAAANRQLWAKWRLIGQVRGMPVKGKVRVWQAMVQTILEQGAEVMRDSVWVEAERVLLKMGRLILGVGGVSIADEVVRGELGLWRVRARRWRKRLVYWMCIVREEVPVLVRTWYGVSRYMNEHKGVTNWCEDTKRILEWLGMGELWENEAEVGKEEWKRVVCRKIHEYEWEEWRKGIAKKKSWPGMGG
jgi:hypothetical protein